MNQIEGTRPNHEAKRNEKSSSPTVAATTTTATKAFFARTKIREIVVRASRARDLDRSVRRDILATRAKALALTRSRKIVAAGGGG